MCVCPRSGWLCGSHVLWSESRDLIQEKNEEEYVMIEVRPEWYIDGIGSNITLNKRDLQKTCTKFCGS